MFGPGRKREEPEIGEVRVLTSADLAEAKPVRSAPATLRDSHHRVARMFAMGLRTAQVAEATGYSYSRVSVLRKSPAFEELVEAYREDVREGLVEAVKEDVYAAIATSNMLKAERQISDKLDEADATGETLPTKELISISRDAADRFGYGKRATQVNLNMDFADALERAIARSKTVEGQVLPLTPMDQSPLVPSGPALQLTRTRR